MSTRTKLLELIEENNKQIENLRQINLSLLRDSYLISDEQQWYDEKNEDTIKWYRRKKTVTTNLVGRIYWNEYFKDEDTGDEIKMERSRVVKFNGEWI